MTTTTTDADRTARSVERLAARVAAAEAKATALRADLEAEAVTMRRHGATLAAIGAVVGMSAPGVLKMLRRHGVTP
jgi:hypothetical protein